MSKNSCESFIQDYLTRCPKKKHIPISPLYIPQKSIRCRAMLVGSQGRLCQLLTNIISTNSLGFLLMRKFAAN